MTAQILSGKEVAQKFRKRVRLRVQKLVDRGLKPPHLTVVQVGDDPGSTVYVRNKVKTCKKLGLESTMHKLEESVSREELSTLIQKLNADADISGILVQLPLPAHLNATEIISEVDPARDVDCLHPANVGRLWLGDSFVTPCTPQGIIEILDHYGIGLKGKRAVIIGRSNIVGKPLAALMLARHATVTICHSRTVDLPAVAREADVLVAAAGKAELVTAEYVKDGAVVIDVGVNRKVDEDGEKKLVGDVDFTAVSEKASAITPVPGGVGPMTIAMLMVNTLGCYEYQHGLSEQGFGT